MLAVAGDMVRLGCGGVNGFGSWLAAIPRKCRAKNADAHGPPATPSVHNMVFVTKVEASKRRMGVSGGGTAPSGGHLNFGSS